MAEKLELCPFCRGTASAYIPYSISCDDCGATTAFFERLEQAFEAWNRRDPNPKTTEQSGI